MRISQARSSGETYAFPKCAYLLIPISNLGRGTQCFVRGPRPHGSVSVLTMAHGPFVSRNDSARIDDYLNPFHFRFLLSDNDHGGLMGSRVSAGASYTVMMANKLPPAVA
nr:hypothetical protein Itr_chr09CG12840 [Ipomoea trifida]